MDRDFSLLAQKLCDQSFFIGADGLIVLNKFENTYKILFYNADGSEANLCGNGLLCAGRLINTLYDEEKVLFETVLDQIPCEIDKTVHIMMPELKAKSLNSLRIDEYSICSSASVFAISCFARL